MPFLQWWHADLLFGQSCHLHQVRRGWMRLFQRRLQDLCFMAVSYTFIDDLLKFTYTGDTDSDMLRKTWSDAMTSLDFKRCRKILIDARQSELNLPVDEIESRTFGLAKHKALVGIKWAVLAENNPLAFGLSRMFATLAEDIGLVVMVFSDLDQAMAWLSSEYEVHTDKG
jgi:hypothetical protein